jgi:hypothetical protein
MQAFHNLTKKKMTIKSVVKFKREVVKTSFIKYTHPCNLKKKIITKLAVLKHAQSSGAVERRS